MKIKILLITLLLGNCWANNIQAQVGEQRYNFSVGVNGGVNLNSVSFQPTVSKGTLMGPTMGVMARYISEKYFGMICGAQLEINYSQQGWTESYQDYPELAYTRKMNYINIPFLAHLAFGKEKYGLQFFINAGPQIGFFLSDSYTQSDNWGDYSGFVVEQHDAPVDNRFDYGITGGAGVELRTKIGHFQVEGRYYYALSDFYSTTKKDYFSRAAHGVISIKVAYLFDVFK